MSARKYEKVETTKEDVKGNIIFTKHSRNTLFLRKFIGDCNIESGKDKGTKAEMSINANLGCYIITFPDAIYTIGLNQIMNTILAHREAEKKQVTENGQKTNRK